MTEKAIICVDDEPVVLEGLKGQLGREFGRDYILELASSGSEALELFEEFTSKDIRVAVLITDQIMPEMKGTELLSIAKDRFPDTLNILLTGQAAADEVGLAVNHGNLYRYIGKPWDRTDLVLTVREALRSYEKEDEIRRKNRQLKEYAEQLEEKVQLRTRELEQEKDRYEELLLNILPAGTAAELRDKGVSSPRYFDQSTILFTDFVGFTQVASRLKPEELIHSLEECFNAFDGIIERNRLEKIKTIGDAYMCAGGLPEPNDSHAMDALRAALEMLAWLRDWNRKREAEGLHSWEMRVGIHTGPVVAGVIGTKKFAYDLWGHAVNLASRMESHGLPGRVNVSQATYEQVKELYRFTDRGEIELKGRGSQRMYVVEE